ncbi:MAG: VOC family protein [Nocardioidaceae bacterium]
MTSEPDPTGPGAAAVEWVTAFLDSPPETAAESEVFWAALTGWTLSQRRGEHAEFATLLPDGGDPYLRVQEVARSVPAGLHLDLHSGDVAGLAARAERLGASASYVEEGLVVCGSPGGMTFCVVGDPGRDGPPAAGVSSGRCAVDQVCLDIPPADWDREVGFWVALTGWTLEPAGEFTRLRPPAGQPLGLLLQHLDDEQPTVTAHLDLACDDRDAEIERQRGMGAEVLRRTDWWTVMRDPSGRRYCVTTRRPDR